MSYAEHPDAAAVRLKCDAPRVSQADLDANIAHEEYVTHVSKGGQVLRWCVITTKSGFAVVGEPAASVSPENDRKELGEKYSRENTIKKLWPLMAYELKSRLAVAPPAPVAEVLPTWGQLSGMTSRDLSMLGWTYSAPEMAYVRARDGKRVRS